MFWIIFITSAVVATVLYVALMFWAAKRDVSNAPKVEMFICDVHGPLPIGATLILFEDLAYETPEGMKTGPMRGCPICFENRIKIAKAYYK